MVIFLIGHLRVGAINERVHRQVRGRRDFDITSVLVRLPFVDQTVGHTKGR